MRDERDRRSVTREKIEKQIEIQAPVQRVWSALTDSRQFGEWFRVKLEGPFVTGETVGGRLTYPGYEHLRMEVVVKAIEPTWYFAYTWHPYAVDAQKNYPQETPTLVEFRLEEKGGSTLLVVTESGFAQLPKERYEDAFRMNNHGWEQQMEHIKAYAGTAV